MMSDKGNPIKPLGKINFFGKGETKQPFPISGMRWEGLYYYIFIDDLQHLLQINKRYKAIRKPESIEPLREVKLIGGGNVIGYKPFLYKGESTVCILAEHLQQLMKINKKYKKLLQKRIHKKTKTKVEPPAEKVKVPEAKPVEKKPKEVKKAKPKRVPKKVKRKPVKRIRPKKEIKLKPLAPKKRAKKVKRPEPTKPKKVQRKVKRVKPKKIARRKAKKPPTPRIIKDLRKFFRI